MLPDSWNKILLKEIATVKDGTHKTPNYTASGVPFLRVTDIKADSIDLSSVKFVSYEEHLELIKRCKPEPGDILYSKNGTIGIPCLIDWDWEFSIFVSLALIKLTKKDIIFTQYLVYVLASDLIKEEIRLRAKTGTVTNLHLEEIKEFQILLPPLAEQKKIAAILSSVDEAIAKTQAVIDQTRKVKQGLLQQLLTRGIGHTKFKDSVIGKIPESWQAIQLSQLVQPDRSISYGIVQTGLSIEGGIPCVRVVDIVKRKIRINELITTTPEISESYHRTILQEKDIMFALRGEIGHVVMADKSLVGANLTRGIALIAPNEKVKPEFLLWAIRSPIVRSEILVRVNGSALQEIPLAQLRQVKVPIPPIMEQVKIAEKLAEIESVININEDQLETLLNLKRSLMQDLLTGRVRVTT